jgi:hypothetical protein
VGPDTAIVLAGLERVGAKVDGVGGAMSVMNRQIGELTTSIDAHEKQDVERHETLCGRLDKLEERQDASTSKTTARAETLRDRRTEWFVRALLMVAGAALALATGALGSACKSAPALPPTPAPAPAPAAAPTSSAPPRP